ncbi:MAG: hypothetical protein M3394_02005 [Actinomycetota bacterium]|nr:hypothetical protein [Actinomycetota bacterium]
MALDSHDRLALHQGLVDGLGRDTADRLMAQLPGFDWSEVALKQDLRALEERLDRRFDRIDHRFELIEHRFELIEHRFESIGSMLDGKTGAHIRSLYFGIAGLMLTVVALTIGAFAAFAYFAD